MNKNIINKSTIFNSSIRRSRGRISLLQVQSQKQLGGGGGGGVPLQLKSMATLSIIRGRGGGGGGGGGGNNELAQYFQGSSSRCGLLSTSIRPLPKSSSLLQSQVRFHPLQYTRPLTTSTKSWLYTETIFASKLILFGSLGILISGGILYLGLHYYLEQQSPTPNIYSLVTRAALHSADHAEIWEGDFARAAGFLNEALKRIEGEVAGVGGWEGALGGGLGSGSDPKSGEKKDGWKEGARGYIQALERLAGLEEKLGYLRKAAERYRRLLRLLGEESPFAEAFGEHSGGVSDVRIRTAVKLAGLIDEVGGDIGDDVRDSAGAVSSALTRVEHALKIEEDEENLRQEKNQKEAERLFQLAYTLSCQKSGLDVGREITGTIPGDEKSLEKVTPEILSTATELGIHYARFRKLDYALPIFLSVLRARTTTPTTIPTTTHPHSSLSDSCEIGKLQSYISEVLWAAGEKQQGVEWCRRAVGTVEGLVEERAACRDCAVLAGGNWIVMVRKLLEEAEEVESRGKGRGWGLWKSGSGSGVGNEMKAELEKELEVAEEMLRGVLEVRVAKGK